MNELYWVSKNLRIVKYCLNYERQKIKILQMFYSVKNRFDSLIPSKMGVLEQLKIFKCKPT